MPQTEHSRQRIRQLRSLLFSSWKLKSTRKLPYCKAYPIDCIMDNFMRQCRTPAGLTVETAGTAPYIFSILPISSATPLFSATFPSANLPCPPRRGSRSRCICVQSGSRFWRQNGGAAAAPSSPPDSSGNI